MNRKTEASTRVQGAVHALERAGMRKTPQRLAIVRAFADDPTHPTAHTIFARLHKTMPTMSFATVYNTLAALESAGSCRALRLEGPAGDAGTRFDPNVEPHDHAVCDRCGAVRDVPATPAARDVQVGGAFRVRTVERIYRGECAACSRE